MILENAVPLPYIATTTVTQTSLAHPTGPGYYLVRWKGHRGWTDWYMCQAHGVFPYLRLEIHAPGDIPRNAVANVEEGNSDAQFVYVPVPVG